MIRMTVALLVCVCPLDAAVNPRLEFALGVLEETRGRDDAAAAHYEKARLEDPTASPLVERGVARRLESGDRRGAITLYREFAAARPDDLSAQLAYSDFLGEQGRGDALAGKIAIDTLDSALEKTPGHPEIIRRLFLLDRHREGLLDQLRDDDPASVLLYASLSRSLYEADNLSARSEVDRRFQLALARFPQDPVLAREAAEHFRKTQRLDQAIGILKRHTEAAPGSLDLRVRLGILYFSAKQDEDGETALKEVLAIHPRKALAHQSLAKFHRLRDRPGPARFHAAELLKIRGGSASEYLKLAEQQLAADQPRDARLLLEKAVFDHPENAELRVRLAIASQRDPESRVRASRLFREAEMATGDSQTKDPAFLSASAEALIEAGQSRAAEDRLRAAIRAYPPDAKRETAAVLRRLAALWEAEERNAEAARALRQRADSLDPQ